MFEKRIDVRTKRLCYYIALTEIMESYLDLQLHQFNYIICKLYFFNIIFKFFLWKNKWW